MAIKSPNGLFLGRKPSAPGAVQFHMNSYTAGALPTPPENFGSYALLGSNCGMLGNDEVGNCVIAEAGHQTMLWNKIAGRTVPFSAAMATGDYSAITGWNPKAPLDKDGENSTDNGTDMATMANFRRKRGVRDAAGNRHTTPAYLAIDPHDIKSVLAAAFMFKGLSIGIMLPENAPDQFDAGQSWTDVPGAQIVGGHCVGVVGKQDDYLLVTTWGKVQRFAIAAYMKWVDEAIAYVSDEDLVDGKSPEGLNRAALVSDLGSLKAAA